MTDDMMNLRSMMEQSSDADFLREMIGYSAQRLMELEVGGLTGAAPGQKSADPRVRLERQGVPHSSQKPRQTRFELRNRFRWPRVQRRLGVSTRGP